MCAGDGYDMEWQVRLCSRKAKKTHGSLQPITLVGRSKVWEIRAGVSERSLGSDSEVGRHSSDLDAEATSDMSPPCSGPT